MQSGWASFRPLRRANQFELVGAAIAASFSGSYPPRRPAEPATGASVPQNQLGTLSERIVMAPPLADAKRARARLAELIERAEGKPEGDALPPLLREGRFRDLTAALADHSPFLWRLALADSARLANLATHAPEETHPDLVDAQASLYREAAAGRIARDDVVRALRRNRAAHALLVALADIGGIWTVEQSTQALSDLADASVRGGVNLLLTEAAGTGRIILKNPGAGRDRKSTRLNSSHPSISYAVFCLKKKKKQK